MGRQIMNRLAAHEHPFSSRHVHYPDAGHLMRPPGVSTSVLDGKFALGGTPPGQAAANRAAWLETVAFLQRGLAGSLTRSPGPHHGEFAMPLKWWQLLLAGVIATASMDVLSAIAIRFRLIAPLAPNLIGRWFASVARAHPLH
jgi:hypothetical protein